MSEAPLIKIGFECEFVNYPPKEFQSECPVCVHILREPYQVTCCGKSFCKDCIKRVKGGGKPCPCCKKEINDFPNKGLQQPLYGFQVYCSNKDRGCEWKGELGQLDRHLNVSETTPENELDGCEYSNIDCTFCQNTHIRNELHHHKTELCDKRPFSCEHCNDYESTYEDVIHNHWPVCDHHPVKCPNECGAFPQRRDTKHHVKNDCPLTLLECDFNYVGCEVRLPRKNVHDHLREHLVTHLSLLAISHNKQQHEIKRLKERQQILQGEVSKLKSHVAIIPVHFMVHNLSQYSDTKQWISPHFYTNSNGYKLCLQMRIRHAREITSFVKTIMVYQGLRIRDSEPSVRIVLSCCLLPGEYDDQLKWPFEGRVMVAFLPNQGHLLPFIDIINAAAQSTREMNGVVCGVTTIKLTDEHFQEYVDNDSLKIRISNIF